MPARRLIVTGRVQGVGYRWWVAEQARELRLNGWVRNCRDGSVEILAAGGDAVLDSLEVRCRSGPPGASVDGVVVEAEAAEPASGFEIKPSA